MKRTRSEVLSEVEELVDEVLEATDGITEAEARAFVWEETDLFDQYRAAEPDRPTTPFEKSAGTMTVADKCAQAVSKRADELLWAEYPNRTGAALRADVWESRDGRLLYQMARSEIGRRPYSEMEQTIAKSFEFVDAFDVLQRWLD